VDVTVQDLVTVPELAEAEALFAGTWPGQPPASTGLLRAVSHAGGYVSGARDGDGALLGAAMGFLADHHGPALHSHLAAVVPAARARGVGLALKLHQRDWARSRGFVAVTWTFDPIVRRNAWFNVSKLGAGVGPYLPDFYGRMDDGVNDGGPTDRLLAVWDVWAESGTTSVAEGDSAGAVAALEEVGGAPVPRTVPADAALVSVATPPDVESLRRGDPPLAGRWRFAVRESLEPLMATGTVAGFTRGGSYLVRLPTSATSRGGRAGARTGRIRSPSRGGHP
jgi:predicted GNAT superfamily acetyltransferase